MGDSTHTHTDKMPRSKRNTVVALTRTSKKTKEQKAGLIEKVQEYTDAFKYLWVFHVEHIAHRRPPRGGRRSPLHRRGAHLLQRLPVIGLRLALAALQCIPLFAFSPARPGRRALHSFIPVSSCCSISL